jgi:hypothetical protein
MYGQKKGPGLSPSHYSMNHKQCFLIFFTAQSDIENYFLDKTDHGIAIAHADK